MACEYSFDGGKTFISKEEFIEQLAKGKLDEFISQGVVDLGKIKSIAPKKTASQDAKNLADKIRGLKIDLSKLSDGGLQSNPLGLPIAVWNSAMDIVAKVVEEGGNIADAIKRGLNYIQNNHRVDFDKNKFYDEIINKLGFDKNNIDFIEANGNKVVDINGYPKLLYRSQDDSRVQGEERQSKHFGIYFSENKESTKIYGSITKSYYVNLKNPQILENSKWNLSVIPEYLFNHLKSKGYDGAIWLRNGEMYEVVAFDKSQIKEVSEKEHFSLPIFKDIKGRGKEIADLLRKGKIKIGGLQSNIAGIPIAIYNMAIETIALGLENGATLAQAVKTAIKKHKLNSLKDYNQSEFIGKIEELVGEKLTISDNKKQKTPPKEEGKGEDKPDKFEVKSILNRIANSTNISEEVRAKFKSNLKYKVSSQAQAREVAKELIAEFGYKDALAMAEMGRFEGDVNSFIFAESLDNAFDKEAKATTPEEKRKFAEEWKDIAMRYDEAARDKGRFISAIQDFYKKSPLGIVMVEESKRGDLFREWFSKREKPLKEVFEELIKEPEFQEIISKEVQEGMKKERAESRKQRRDKIEKFFDDAKFKGDALYAVPIPPNVINGGIEAMKQAFLAGESVVNAVEVAVDYISKQVSDWDKEKFRKEYQDKLNELENKKGKKTAEELSEEKKEKLLDKFRKKLKGLSEKEKDEVIRKAFKKLVENGALEYDDFKNIIAETLGYGKLTEAEVAKITELVSDINEVDKIAESIRQEENRSIENLKKYKEAKAKAEKSATELAAIVYNNPDILKRLLSIMQLNTLGIPSLVNNPIFNIVNQAIVRFPIGIQLSVLDQILYGASKIGNKLFGTNVLLPENNILTSQKEFFKKAGEGSVESGRQLINGLTNRDYFQKEVYASQIQPFTSAKDLWDWKTKGKKLTTKQLVDKAIQSTVGLPAEVVARLLNVGDKPQRYAAEGAKASTFAKNMGLDNVDYEYFLEFPKEEAYRYYKNQGMEDAEAMAKAEKTKEAIIKAGEESVFQQDNLVNDALNAVFEASKKYGNVPYGIGQAVKMFNFPYLKIPLNAFWSAYNLVVPEVAFTQSLIYSIKAIKTKDSGDIQKAKMWAAHGATGMALVAIAGSLVAKGIINADNDDEVSKKERGGEKQYEQQKSINVTKLHALLTGKDPDSVKVGLNVDLKYLAVMGNILNTVAIREEKLTKEQKEQREDYLRQLYSNLSLSGLELINNGVFSNASSLLTAIDRGGFYMDSYLLNLINMGTNIVQPAMFAQMSRAQLPYYSKVKADTFYEQLKNNLLARSSVVRELTGKYPPSQVGIWGDKLERKDDFILKWFGMSTVTKDNFAQPIYEDYKRTKNTAFFPPSVKPSINDIKLNTKQAEEFEILVGKERRALVAPYINDLAKFDIIDKRYSELDDTQKVAVLEALYKIGFNNAKDKFTQLYPEFKKEENIDEDKIIKDAELGALKKILGIGE